MNDTLKAATVAAVVSGFFLLGNTVVSDYVGSDKWVTETKFDVYGDLLASSSELMVLWSKGITYDAQKEPLSMGWASGGYLKGMVVVTPESTITRADAILLRQKIARAMLLAKPDLVNDLQQLHLLLSDRLLFEPRDSTIVQGSKVHIDWDRSRNQVSHLLESILESMRNELTTND